MRALTAVGRVFGRHVNWAMKIDSRNELLVLVKVFHTAKWCVPSDDVTGYEIAGSPFFSRLYCSAVAELRQIEIATGLSSETKWAKWMAVESHPYALTRTRERLARIGNWLEWPEQDRRKLSPTC